MMERLGVTLAGAPIYGWHEVATWARHLPEGSAVWRARHPDESAWVTRRATSEQLASIFDAVMGVAHTLATRWAAEGTHPKMPKPYPLPWRSGNDTSRLGRGAIAVSDFDDWYYSDER